MKQGQSLVVDYRKLKPQESGEYRLLRLESLKIYPNCFGSKYEVEKQKENLAFESYIENSNQESFIVGAFQKDQLIGICGFYRLQDRQSRHKGEIIQMYVQEAYQGRNIGYSLLLKTIAIAFTLEDLEQINLEVMTENKAARNVYEKAGFLEYGRQRSYTDENRPSSEQMIMILNMKNWLTKK